MGRGHQRPLPRLDIATCQLDVHTDSGVRFSLLLDARVWWTMADLLTVVAQTFQPEPWVLHTFEAVEDRLSCLSLSLNQSESCRYIDAVRH